MRRRLQLPLAIDDLGGVSQELLTNGYVEVMDGRAVIRSHPGVIEFGDVALEYRGSLEIGGVVYVVAGTGLYTFADNGVFSASLGTVPGSGYVMMAGVADNLTILTSTGASYRYNGTNIVQITDPAYQTASSVSYLNGTTIWAVDNGEEFIWSAVSDASDISGLDIASAEFKPDKLVRAYVFRNDLLLFGKKSIEGWFDAGSATSAYERRGDLLLNVGLAGKYALTEIADMLFFFASDGTVRMLEGGAPVRISTAPVERVINGDRDHDGWTDFSLVRAFSYIWHGQLMIAFRHPEGCIEYNLTSKQWSKRASVGSDTWAAIDAINAYDRYLLFNGAGAVWQMTEDTRKEINGHVPWIATFQPFSIGGERFIVDEVEFEFAAGESSAEAFVFIEVSNDRRTFGTAKRRSLGASGAYTNRIRATALGQTREQSYRLTVTDDVPVKLSDAWITYRPCRG